MNGKRLFFATMVIAVATSQAFSQHYPAAPTDKFKAKEKREVAPHHGRASRLQPLAVAYLLSPIADLRIKQYLFPPADDKALKVRVVNTGNVASGNCVLRLTVRKINGVAVGRVIEIKLPALAAGKNKWFVIKAASILPKNVSLESTTFKLNVDVNEVVAESNESNNEVWHNL